jgi:hypothetical protein
LNIDAHQKSPAMIAPAKLPILRDAARMRLSLLPENDENSRRRFTPRNSPLLFPSETKCKPAAQDDDVRATPQNHHSIVRRVDKRGRRIDNRRRICEEMHRTLIPTEMDIFDESP